ncbi:c-type cytochrome domain-containing protein, partial [Singulisphaera rosea]
MVGRTNFAPGSPALGYLLGLALLLIPARGAEPDAKELEYFESKVRPILVERCYSCHSTEAKKSRGNLLLDSKDGWQKGGDSGPAIVPGSPDQSPIVKAIRYDDPDLKMPPKGKLAEEEIAILEAWVKRGAHDPRAKPVAASGKRVIDIEGGRSFWSFQPLSTAPLPVVRDPSRCSNDIDRFVLAALESRGIEPNRPLARRQLIRRASFDLVGLPPTPEEVEAF